ncbi:MAG: ferritin-like domain-containing protein, partial [Alphaproteobacteria bacterium]
YCLFHASMSRYLQRENLTLLERLREAFDRVAETEDGELATACWAANSHDGHFDRHRNSVAYARDSLQYYRPH